MKLRQTLNFFIFSTALFFAFSMATQEAHAQAKAPVKHKVAQGTFTELEQGDYFYFVITLANGETQSFRVEKPDALYQQVEKNPEKYKGKKVKVTYETKNIYTPEAGGEIEVDRYLKAEWLK